MKCKFCSAEFDSKHNVCPICGRPTENYRDGMRTNVGKVSDRTDFVEEYKKTIKENLKEEENNNTDENQSEINVTNEIKDKSIQTVVAENEETEKKSGSKKPIIIAVTVVVLFAVGLFAGFKYGMYEKLNKGVNVDYEASTSENEIDVTYEVESVAFIETTTQKQLKQGKYKVIRENGAQMYSTNIISNSTPTHIASKNEILKINSFYVDGDTVLGFAVIGDYDGWVDMNYVEFISSETAEATVNEQTTKVPVTKIEATTKTETTTKAEVTTQKASNKNYTSGSYVVSSSVGDTDNGCLNVRSTTDSYVDNTVAVLFPGDKVTVIEWEGNWAKISYQGKELGYVYGAYLEEN